MIDILGMFFILVGKILLLTNKKRIISLSFLTADILFLIFGIYITSYGLIILSAIISIFDIRDIIKKGEKKMEKCKKCGKTIGYMKYHCPKCKKELAGPKQKKSRGICSGCSNTFYNTKYPDKNPFGGKGCMSYKSSKVIIKDVYYSLNQVVPNPRWKLNCFIKQY